MMQGRHAEAWQIYQATVKRIDAMDSRLQPLYAGIQVVALRLLGCMCKTVFVQYDIALAYYEQSWQLMNDKSLFEQEVQSNKVAQQVIRVELQLLSTWPLWESRRSRRVPCLCSACQRVSTLCMVCVCGCAWYCSSECEIAFAAKHIHFRIPLAEIPKDVVRTHILPTLWKQPFQKVRPAFWLGLRTLCRTWRDHIDSCPHIWYNIITLNWSPTYRPVLHLQGEEHTTTVAYVMMLAKKRQLVRLKAGHAEIKVRLQAKEKELEKLRHVVHQLDWELKTREMKMKELE